MPGAGIDAGSVGLLRSKLPLTDVPASCSEPLPAPASKLATLGFDSSSRRQTSSAKVVALKAELLG
jgi:copper homeostasis protein